MVDALYNIDTHVDNDAISAGSRLRIRHEETPLTYDWEYTTVGDQNVLTVDDTHSDFTVIYTVPSELLLENSYITQSPNTIPPVLFFDNDYDSMSPVPIPAQALTTHSTKNNPNEGCFSTKKEESFWTKTERNYRQFRDDLLNVFEEFPIEDGINHPADDIIEQFLCNDNQTFRKALVRSYNEFKDSRPAISAAFLRCTARVDFAKIGDIGLSLAQDALDHNNIEIRDAAVRALENWGGKEAINILRKHNDTESWLRRYIDQVIIDLSDATL